MKELKLFRFLQNGRFLDTILAQMKTQNSGKSYWRLLGVEKFYFKTHETSSLFFKRENKTFAGGTKPFYVLSKSSDDFEYDGGGRCFALSGNFSRLKGNIFSPFKESQTKIKISDYVALMPAAATYEKPNKIISLCNKLKPPSVQCFKKNLKASKMSKLTTRGEQKAHSE